MPGCNPLVAGNAEGMRAMLIFPHRRRSPPRMPRSVLIGGLDASDYPLLHIVLRHFAISAIVARTEQGRLGMVRKFMAAAFACMLLAGGSAWAQVEEKKFNVVGTWNFLTNWKVLEVPFWEPGPAESLGRQDVPATSSPSRSSISRAPRCCACSRPASTTSPPRCRSTSTTAAPIVEASDIAGVARTFKMSREIIDALDARDAEGDEGAARRHRAGHLHLARAELLLPRRHQERRRPQGQEDPRAGRHRRPTS